MRTFLLNVVFSIALIGSNTSLVIGGYSGCYGLTCPCDEKLYTVPSGHFGRCLLTTYSSSWFGNDGAGPSGKGTDFQKKCADGQYINRLEAYRMQYEGHNVTYQVNWQCTNGEVMTLSGSSRPKVANGPPPLWMKMKLHPQIFPNFLEYRYLSEESKTGFPEVQVDSGKYVDYIGVNGKGMMNPESGNIEPVTRYCPEADGYQRVLAGFEVKTSAVLNGIRFVFRCLKIPKQSKQWMSWLVLKFNTYFDNILRFD